MVDEETFVSLIFAYCCTFLIEPIFRNVRNISSISKYGVIFYVLPTNTTWFIHNSVLLQTCLVVFIFASLLANNHRSTQIIWLKFFDLIPIFFDIINALSIYNKYSLSLINFAFIFGLIRLANKFHLVSRNYPRDQLTKRTIFTFDLTLCILIQTIFVRYSLINLFDLLRQVILYIIIYESHDALDSKPEQVDLEIFSSAEQITQQKFSTYSIVLFLLIFDWRHFSIWSLLGSAMVLVLIYYDTKYYLDELMRPYNPRTCSICYNEKQWYSFEMVIIFSCKHEIRCVCDECLLQHVRIAIQQTFRDDILCPEENCGLRFDYQSVGNILSLTNDKQLLDRYDRYVLHRKLEQMDEFIWCSNPSCGAGQLNEGGRLNPIVICYRCHQKTCFIHRVSWHEGMTCEEYDEQADPVYELSRQWIVTHTKKCPKCPWQIEKNYGCDHMTCFKCGHEFCWSCLADFQPIRNEGNHRHRDTCKHYAAYGQN